MTDQACTVRFWADAHSTPYIETKPIHESQMTAERHEDGSAVFQLHVCQNYELEKSLIEYGEGIKVLAPKELASRISGRLKEAAGLYDALLPIF